MEQIKRAGIYPILLVFTLLSISGCLESIQEMFSLTISQKSDQDDLAKVKKQNDSSPKFAYERDRKRRVIVFVHGIFGDAFETWKNKASGMYFFDLMKDDDPFKDSAVFVYGFPSSFWTHSFSINDAVVDLHLQLENAGVLQYQEIVFVSHSMGGLITQQFLLTYRELAPKVPMMFFFSTPQEGAAVTKLAVNLLNNPGLRAMFPMDENDFLQTFDTQWKQARKKKAINTIIRCATERYDTLGVRIVDFSSGTRSCDGPSQPIDADHIQIVKPVDKEARSYKAFKTAFKEEVQDQPNPKASLKPETIPDQSSHVGMVEITGGDFIMGTSKEEIEEVYNHFRSNPRTKKWWFEDELPRHKRNIGTIWMDRFEVTNAEYAHFLDSPQGKNYPKPITWVDDNIPPGKSNHPVTGISRIMATAYCKFLGKRLPTETEWEKAARGPEGNFYPWGDTPETAKTNTVEAQRLGTNEVGKTLGDRSYYGIHDMGGNVMEWVYDLYNPYPGNNDMSEDARRAFDEHRNWAVARGGSYDTFILDGRGANRRYFGPAHQGKDIGFRCASD